MRALRVLLVVVVLAIPGSAAAHPVHARLGVGAHYWFRDRGLFDLTISVEGMIVGPLYIGGRVGAGVLLYPQDRERVAIPIDVMIGVLIINMLYIEAVAGPWLTIDTGDLLRGHAGLGFGFYRGLFWIGVEAAYLEPDAILGVRLGLRFGN